MYIYTHNLFESLVDPFQCFGQRTGKSLSQGEASHGYTEAGDPSPGTEISGHERHEIHCVVASCCVSLDE